MNKSDQVLMLAVAFQDHRKVKNLTNRKQSNWNVPFVAKCQVELPHFPTTLIRYKKLLLKIAIIEHPLAKLKYYTP